MCSTKWRNRKYVFCTIIIIIIIIIIINTQIY